MTTTTITRREAVLSIHRCDDRPETPHTTTIGIGPGTMAAEAELLEVDPDDLGEHQAERLLVALCSALPRCTLRPLADMLVDECPDVPAVVRRWRMGMLIGLVAGLAVGLTIGGLLL